MKMVVKGLSNLELDRSLASTLLVRIVHFGKELELPMEHMKATSWLGRGQVEMVMGRRKFEALLV